VSEEGDVVREILRSPRGRKVARASAEASADMSSGGGGGGGGGGGQIVRRRTLVRRQSSQSPAKTSTSSPSRPSAAEAAECPPKSSSAAASAATASDESLQTAKVTLLLGGKDNDKIRKVLLSHLETIKRQSEDIMKKDVQLKELQRENQRLREQLKQLEETQTGFSSTLTSSSPPPACTTPPAASEATTSSSPPPQSTSQQQYTNCNTKARLLHVIVPHIQKKSTKDVSVCTDINNINVPLNVTGSASGEVPKKKRRRRKRVVSESAEKNAEKKEASPEPEKPSMAPLMTKEPYLVTTSLELVASEKAEAEVIIKSSEQVPCWRLAPSPVSPIHSMEGTECLENDELTARHARQEAIEKKRKRWDIQRIRELRKVAALKERQERGRRPAWAAVQMLSPSSSSPTRSFLPDPLTDLTHMVVADTLPVTAFGLEVPDVPSADFDLYWMQHQPIS